jgi:serine phosphatase RsbU (regulator of sigma subunit)
MAKLQASLRSQSAMASDQPQCFLRSVNHLFYENTADGDSGTFFFSEYDDKTQRLRYVNCGHLSARLLRRDDTVERLESRSWDFLRIGIVRLKNADSSPERHSSCTPTE